MPLVRHPFLAPASCKNPLSQRRMPDGFSASFRASWESCTSRTVALRFRQAVLRGAKGVPTQGSHQSPSCRMCGTNALSEPDTLRLLNGDCVCAKCQQGIKSYKYPERYQALLDSHTQACTSLMKQRSEYEASLRLAVLRNICDRVTPVAASSGYLLLLAVIPMSCVGWLAKLAVIPVLLLAVLLLVVSVLSALCGAICRRRVRRSLSLWDSAHPAPASPTLRGLFDVEVALTQRDELVKEILAVWPGMPPHWANMRQAAIHRDNRRCQVSGCPSRLKLHVHHKKARCEGGTHQADNLVSLCAFHHAIQPEQHHSGLRDRLDTPYFTLYSERRSDGEAPRVYLKRKRLITEAELSAIMAWHGMTCRACGSPRATVEFKKRLRRIAVQCNSCNAVWTFERKTAEETGPEIAAELCLTKNAGCWKFTPLLLGDQEA